MITLNKNARQLVWQLYVDNAVEGSELECYNTEGDRNSVVSQASCRMDVTFLELEMSKFAVFRWQRTMDSLGDNFEGL